MMENYYDQAVEAVREGRIAPRPSALEKYLRIGWKLACSIIDRMEADGIVTPPDVTGRRSLTKEPTQ
ncbi:MAG: putative Ftsk gamma domain protein [Prokaryotic dsDNA virus sp.]|nr:MAG: putative Ftsk gamma domain protein [Prokaryotic dsDNA virus sp.]|tara:strand:- start:47454 stop:47654 length:201 start_codon:yes stop_codon:yes gene_type:complete